jgi:chromosome segregation ATPase
MTRAHKVLGFLLVALVGIYGCAQGPAQPPTPTASTEAKGNPGLEARVHRLEEDYKAATAARDSLKQKLTAAEEQQARLQKQIEQAREEATQERNAIAAERDALKTEREALKAEVKARTAERDEVRTQYTTYIKSVREQTDKAESTLNGPAAPVNPAAISTQPQR